MNKVLKYILMMPVILFTACTNNSEMQSLIQTKLSSINESLVTDTKNIIIIPGEGCGGCISQITSDLILGIDTLNSNVIFTGVNDKKLLRYQVGEEVLNHPLVYIDAKNVMMDTRISSIYPQIILIKSNTYTLKLY